MFVIVTVETLEDLGKYLIGYAKKWVYGIRNLLPTNSYNDWDDWESYAYIGAINVFNRYLNRQLPLTIDRQIYALFKKAAIQEIRNRIQDLTTKKRNINITINFTELQYNNMSLETVIDNMSIVYSVSPETILLWHESQTLHVEVKHGKNRKI